MKFSISFNCLCFLSIIFYFSIYNENKVLLILTKYLCNKFIFENINKANEYMLFFVDLKLKF